MSRESLPVKSIFVISHNTPPFVNVSFYAVFTNFQKIKKIFRKPLAILCNVWYYLDTTQKGVNQMKTTVELFKELLDEVKYNNYEPNYTRNYIMGAYDMAKTVATIKGEDTAELILLTHDFLYKK